MERDEALDDLYDDARWSHDRQCEFGTDCPTRHRHIRVYQDKYTARTLDLLLADPDTRPHAVAAIRRAVREGRR